MFSGHYNDFISQIHEDGNSLFLSANHNSDLVSEVFHSSDLGRPNANSESDGIFKQPSSQLNDVMLSLATEETSLSKETATKQMAGNLFEEEGKST